MVYIACAFIVGIPFNKNFKTLSLLLLLNILLIVIYIFIRKWNSSFLLIFPLMIFFVYYFLSYRNNVFIVSLDEVKDFAKNPIENSGIVVEDSNYSNGQRLLKIPIERIDWK